MADKETFKLDANEIGDKVKNLIHEGNVRRIIVRKDENVIAEFPLTAAVVGAVLAPVLAAIGAIAALATNCTIEVERDVPAGEDAPKDAG
jgi:hypothetical protein